MDLKKLHVNIKKALHKYIYIVLILIVGIILMVLPTKKETPDSQQAIVTENPVKSFDDTLAEVLSLIDGAGKVRVLLTISVGEKTIYQLDEDSNSDSDSSSSKQKTVIITNAEKSQVGLIKQVNPPEYLGAVILCQGADSPSVKLAIIDAVSKITGLGANKISVLKMK